MHGKSTNHVDPLSEITVEVGGQANVATLHKISRDFRSTLYSTLSEYELTAQATLSRCLQTPSCSLD
jgi:hypothetical protein